MINPKQSDFRAQALHHCSPSPPHHHLPNSSNFVDSASKYFMGPFSCLQPTAAILALTMFKKIMPISGSLTPWVHLWPMSLASGYKLGCISIKYPPSAIMIVPSTIILEKEPDSLPLTYFWVFLEGVSHVFRNESLLTWEPPTPAVICHVYTHHPHFGCCLAGPQSLTVLRVQNGSSLPLAPQFYLQPEMRTVASFEFYAPFCRRRHKRTAFLT